MFEALVSSKIRRALFEYLLTHPHERFYLRGLAKELGLSISPLRRELKRLKQTGLLTSTQEANLIFYTANTTSPLFLQLNQASQPTEAPSPAIAPPHTQLAEWGVGLVGLSSAPAPTSAPSATDVVPARQLPQEFAQPSLPRREKAIRHACRPGDGTGRHPAGPAVSVGIISATPRVSVWRKALSSPALVGMAGAGLALVLLVAGGVYLSLLNHRLLAQAARLLQGRTTEIVRLPSEPSASGLMRGGRWQLLPGSFGGFSTHEDAESY